MKSIQVQLKLHLKEKSQPHVRFTPKKYRKCTKLSKYILSLKNQSIKPIVKWRIVRSVSLNYCKLFLTEKFFLIKSLDDSNLLNERSGHQNKLLLCNVKNDSPECLYLYFLVIYFFFIFRQKFRKYVYKLGLE